MLRALLHTNYVKLSLVPRPLDKLPKGHTQRVWPVTIVDQVDLGLCYRTNERSWSRVLGIVIAECLSVSSRLLHLRLSVLVCHTCMSKFKLLHCSSSYITYCA